jgi:SAM-dependent methyltransferase
VLSEHLPETGRALEIASGSGQHAAAFAKAFPGIDWVPSDPDERARDSIAAWAEEAGSDNLMPVLDIDVTRAAWNEDVEGPFNAILAINMVHISPWAAAEGLLRGAGSLLTSGGLLYLYGPYRKDDAHTADSNIKFDAWLKGQNEQWGVRDMGEVKHQGELNGLHLGETIEMPANNFSLIFRKA